MRKSEKNNDIKMHNILKMVLPVAVMAVITIAIVVITVKLPRESIASATEAVTLEMSETAETITETSTETLTVADSTKSGKKSPKIKPVGTTKPAEKENVAAVAPTETLPKGNNLHLLDVGYIYQMNNYPTGCESISAVMALNFAGYGISPENYIDNHLPKGAKPFYDENNNMFGDDPRECFLGNPYEKSGWGCYAPVIQKGLDEVIDHSRHKVVNLSGKSLQDLCSYIDNGTPVIIWATQNMAPPRTGKTWNLLDDDATFTWISPNHCLLLVGYDDNYFYFNDPMVSKNCTYPREVTQSRYRYMGSQALAIVKAEPKTTEKVTETETITTTTTEAETSQSSTENLSTTISDSETSTVSNTHKGVIK